MLSAEERKIFEDAASETRDFQRKVAREMSDKSREFLIKSGMQINDIAPGEISRMREKVKPVIDKYASQVGETVVKQFDAELAKAREAVR
jgi:TRAP-type transport system periplasmic protein